MAHENDTALTISERVERIRTLTNSRVKATRSSPIADALGDSGSPAREIGEVNGSSDTVPLLVEQFLDFPTPFDQTFPFDQLPFDQFVPFDQIPFDELPFDELPFDQLPFDELPFDQIPFDELPFDQIPFDELPFDQFVPFDQIPFDELPFDELLVILSEDEPSSESAPLNVAQQNGGDADDGPGTYEDAS